MRPLQGNGPIQCWNALSGIIHDYCREAAQAEWRRSWGFLTLQPRAALKL
jgi:hypothetical protein